MSQVKVQLTKTASWLYQIESNRFISQRIAHHYRRQLRQRNSSRADLSKDDLTGSTGYRRRDCSRHAAAFANRFGVSFNFRRRREPSGSSFEMNARKQRRGRLHRFVPAPRASTTTRHK